jgi:hypothetical protein
LANIVQTEFTASYHSGFPVVLFILIMPVAGVGRSAVVPTGIVKAPVVPPTTTPEVFPEIEEFPLPPSNVKAMTLSPFN